MNQQVYLIKSTLLIVIALYLIRLFNLQVISDEYRNAAKNNSVRISIKNPYRGEIYDSKGKLLVHNEPVFEIKMLKNEFSKIPKDEFCSLFEANDKEYEDLKKNFKSVSKIKPLTAVKNLTNETFKRIQHKLHKYSGIIINPNITRSYENPTLAHTIGYLSEVPMSILSNDNYYTPGDNIGTDGLEKQYEVLLRGIKGTIHEIVDVNGISKGSFKNGKYDIKPKPGANLYSSIDLNLQLYCKKLMHGKKGGVVVINPKTGGIIACVSNPNYDPNLLKGKHIRANYSSLLNDPDKPLFNRATSAMYSPGSIFKPIQSALGLSTGVIDTRKTIICNTNLIKCRNHPCHTNLNDAIKYSCNHYFYTTFKRMILQNSESNIYMTSNKGLERWANSVAEFGLGDKLGIDIPAEKGGFVPKPIFYDKVYGKGRWSWSTIRSLDIGQGELLITPLQMANIAVVFANKGYYYNPHFVEKIGPYNDDKDIPYHELERKNIKYEVVSHDDKLEVVITHRENKINIESHYFDIVNKAMLNTTRGSAWRARIPGINICCKTGTVENDHGEDHSVFMGFAPYEEPNIAIAVFVENAGWGSRAATSIAGLVIEKYLTGNTKRKYIEDYVLKGKFLG